MTGVDQPPDGPTCVTWYASTTSGGVRDKRSCWHTGVEAQAFTRRWPLPAGWRYERCTHLPEPPRDAL